MLVLAQVGKALIKLLCTEVDQAASSTVSPTAELTSKKQLGCCVWIDSQDQLALLAVGGCSGKGSGL